MAFKSYSLLDNESINPLLIDKEPLASVATQQDVQKDATGTSLLERAKSSTGTPAVEGKKQNWSQIPGGEVGNIGGTHSTQFSTEPSVLERDPIVDPVIPNAGTGNNQPAGSNAVDQTKKLSKWSQAVQDGDWGEAAGILAGVATHAAKLVSILDGSWAESQKKIIGMGKYHGPGRAWWA